LIPISLRNKLIEQDWQQVKSKEKNATTSWNRIRDKANDRLEDLRFLAQRMPNELQEEIFNIPNIEPLAHSILFPLRKDFDYDELDSRRTQLAAIFVREGLNKCIAQYRTRIEKSEILTKENLELLEEAKMICDEIALRIWRLQDIESKTINQRLVFLFGWDNIPGDAEEEERLREFLKNKCNESWLQYAQIEKRSNAKEIHISPRNGNNLSSISIHLNQNDEIKLTCYNSKGEEKYSTVDELVVKQNNGNASVHYKKKKVRRKIKDKDDSPRPSSIFS
jgi:hypothetical protein